MNQQRTGWAPISPEQRQAAVVSAVTPGFAYLNSQLPIYACQDGDQNHLRLVQILEQDGQDPELNAAPWGLPLNTYYCNALRTVFAALPNSPQAEKIAMAQQEARASGEQERANALRTTRRVICYVIDLMENNALKVYPVPPSVIENLLNFAKDPSTGRVMGLEDPLEGRPFWLSRKGKGIDTRYMVMRLGDPMPLIDASGNCLELGQVVLSKMGSFKQMIRFMSDADADTFIAAAGTTPEMATGDTAQQNTPPQGNQGGGWGGNQQGQAPQDAPQQNMPQGGGWGGNQQTQSEADVKQRIQESLKAQQAQGGPTQ